MRKYGWKLLNLVPDDFESQRMLARSYLDERGFYRRSSARRGSGYERPLSVISSLWQREELTAEEQLRFADMLEDVEEYKRSLEIVLPLVIDGLLGSESQEEALEIAARTAQRLGRTDVLKDLVARIPPQDWPPPVLATAVELREEAGDLAAAFAYAKRYLEQEGQEGDVTVEMLERGGHLANQLNRIEELEEVLRSSIDYPLLWGMSHLLKELGLPGLASEVETSEREARPFRSRAIPRRRATTRRLPV